MAYLALGVLGLVGLYGLMRLFLVARPAQVRAVLGWGGATIAVLLLTVFLVSRLGINGLATLLGLAPLVWRWLQGRRAAKTFSQGPAAGQASDVETACLHMTLDHASGRMTGRVKAGAAAGRDLADMPLADLLRLLAELGTLDPDGVPLLEAWLDRAHPDWRSESPAVDAVGPMSRADALAVLGLSEGATEEQIRAAHRRLMRDAHPDRGGSGELASRLNAARDILL